MNFTVLATSKALEKHLADLRGATRSRRFYQCRQRIAGAIDGDYRSFLLAGIDSQGRRVPDASGIKRRRKGIYAGAPGEPGTPFGRRSLLYANYGSRWVEQSGSWELVRFVAGFPAAKFLLRRFRYGGIRATTWSKVRLATREFLEWYTNPANAGESS